MKHPLLNKIKIPIIIMAATVLLATLNMLGSWYSITTFGKIIHQFYPCTKDFFPADDSHCYVGYDILILFILAGIFILSSLTALIKTVLYSYSLKKL